LSRENTVRTILMTLLLALLTLGLDCGQPLAAVAPDFNLRTPEGKRINLKALLAGGPVLLDFWATWCRPCVKAMPKLAGIHEEYNPRGLTVVGVNEDGPRGQARVRPFLKARKITFPIAMDLDGAVASRLQVSALPTTILVAPDGEIVLREVGFGPESEARLLRAIEGLLPADQAE
jgi:cytochrome c biogenesis protein CcmG, thiol:disulfide interchange protein DsbE